MSLQHIFNDVCEVEDNVEACEKPQNQIEDKELRVEKKESRLEQEGANLSFDSFLDKKEVYCFMYSILECHGSELADPLVEEQAVVPIFMFDDIAEFF